MSCECIGVKGILSWSARRAGRSLCAPWAGHPRASYAPLARERAVVFFAALAVARFAVVVFFAVGLFTVEAAVLFERAELAFFAAGFFAPSVAFCPRVEARRAVVAAPSW